MKAGALWYRIGSAMTCDTAGGRGVGPAVIRYCLMYGFATGGRGYRRVRGPLRAEREGRVAVREEEDVRVRPRLPAQEAEHEVVQAARVVAGEEDREAGGNRAEE